MQPVQCAAAAGGGGGGVARAMRDACMAGQHAPPLGPTCVQRSPPCVAGPGAPSAAAPVPRGGEASSRDPLATNTFSSSFVPFGSFNTKPLVAATNISAQEVPVIFFLPFWSAKMKNVLPFAIHEWSASGYLFAATAAAVLLLPCCCYYCRSCAGRDIWYTCT